MDARTTWKQILGWKRGDLVKVWCGIGYIADYGFYLENEKQGIDYLVHFLIPHYCSKVFKPNEMKDLAPWERKIAKEQARKFGIKGIY